MKKVIWGLFLLLIFSNAFAFEKTILPNQTKLILKPETSHEIVALQCFIPGLLNQENVTQSGLAQLTLEAILKGTKHKTEKEIFNALEPFGSKLDVSLARDFGLITLISTKDQFEKDLALFLEILKEPAFDTKEIQKLKLTLLQNQKSRQEDPFTLAMDKLQKELYPHHPYGKIIVGETKTMTALTTKDVQSFYTQTISKTPLIISVVGNFNLAKTKQTLTNALRSWGKDVEIKTFKTNTNLQNKTIVLKQKMNAVNFLMAYSAPSGASKDFVTLQVLNNILGGKSSSRIFSQIREAKGLGYALGSFYPLRKEGSQFVLYITVDPKAKKEFPHLFLKIVNDLKNKPVSESELQAAQTHLKSKFLMDHQMTSQRAWYLGLYENVGLQAAFDDDYEKQIDAITAKDIQKAAQKYLTHYLLIRQEQ